MKQALKTTSRAVFDGKPYKSLEELLNTRKVIGPGRFYMKKNAKALSKVLFSIYSKLSNILDKTIADTLGGKIIPNISGRGVIPDIIFDDTVAEGKSISTTVDTSGIVTKASKIAIAGGRGTRLKEGSKDYVTGAKGGELTTEKANITQSFIDRLVAAKDNQQELKKIMSDKRSNAATILRKNFMLKSGDIRVPLTVGNKQELRAIRFTWKDVQKSKYAKIKITIDKKTGHVFFNIYFTSSLVRDTLNKATGNMIQTLKPLTDMLAKDLAEEFAQFSPKVIKFLNSQKMTKDIIYDEGSALIGKGAIKTKKRGSQAQRFISGAQLSTLVRKRMGKIMPKGPRRGPPLSPNVLTERTGRFRRSTRIIPNYRKNMMQYFYNPLYGVHRDTDRNPDELIEKSVKEIVTALFTRQFRIVRGF
jgi:hypothetical protein